MPAIRLPVPESNLSSQPVEKQVQALTDLVMRFRRELEYLLNGNLDEDNGVIKAEVAYIEQIFTEYLTTNVLEANTIFTNIVTAQKGYIADLTVASLDTSDMVERYLLPSTNLLRKAPVKYQRINDEVRERLVATYVGDILNDQAWAGYPNSPPEACAYPYQIIGILGEDTFLICATVEQYYGSYIDAPWAVWVLDAGVWAAVFSDNSGDPHFPTAPTYANHNIYDGPAHTTLVLATTDAMGELVEVTTQVTDRNGTPIYWLDAEHIGNGWTYDETDYPVMRFVYDGPDGLGIVKEIEYFGEDDEGNVIPMKRHGTGNGVDDNGRMFEAKWADGYEQKYIATGAGAVSPYEAVALKLGDDGPVITNPGPLGLRNIAIGATPPDAPVENDLWIDTDA